MTETYRNLRNESIEALRYTKLIAEIVSKKLAIEKIINIKNPSNDLFIIITVDNKNHCISKHFSFEPEDAVFSVFGSVKIFPILIMRKSTSDTPR